MTSGYSGTALAKKLGIKEGHRVATLGAPAHFAGLVQPLPPGVRFRSGIRGCRPMDVIVVFAVTVRDLTTRFQRARGALSSNGGLWVAWPKRTSALAGELRESDVREYGLSAGLVDNKICAIDDDWSGLRFVIRSVDRV
jgi:Protein of unknown function (DUF3052)